MQVSFALTNLEATRGYWSKIYVSLCLHLTCAQIIPKQEGGTDLYCRSNEVNALHAAEIDVVLCLHLPRCLCSLQDWSSQSAPMLRLVEAPLLWPVAMLHDKKSRNGGKGTGEAVGLFLIGKVDCMGMDIDERSAICTIFPSVLFKSEPISLLTSWDSDLCHVSPLNQRNIPPSIQRSSAISSQDTFKDVKPIRVIHRQATEPKSKSRTSNHYTSHDVTWKEDWYMTKDQKGS